MFRRGQFLLLGILINLSLYGQSNQELRPKRYTDGTYGYVNRSESYVITPKFHKAYPFNKGYARVQMYGNWGLIDKQGEWVLKPKYQYVGWSDDPFFQVNKAWLHLSNSKGIHGEMFFPPAENKIGVLEEGKWLLKGLQSGFKTKPFDSLRHFTGNYAGIYSKGNGWNVINLNKGQPVWEDYFPDVNTLSCDLVGVRRDSMIWDVIDPASGSMVKEGFLELASLSEDFWAARSEIGWGVLNKEGQLMANPEYRQVKFLPYINKIRLNPKSFWFLLDEKLQEEWKKQIDTAYFLSTGEIVLENAGIGEYQLEGDRNESSRFGEKMVPEKGYWIRYHRGRREIFLDFPSPGDNGVLFDSLIISEDYLMVRDPRKNWRILKKDLNPIAELGSYVNKVNENLIDVREKNGGRLFNIYTRQWNDSIYDKYYPTEFGFIYCIKKGVKGLLDRSGELIVEPTPIYFRPLDEHHVVFLHLNSIEILDVDSLSRIIIQGESLHNNGDHSYVMVSANGKQLLDEEFQKIIPQRVKNISTEYENGKVNLKTGKGWGIYDINTRSYLIKPSMEYDSIGVGGASEIPVWINGNMGFLGYEGALKISTQYQQVRYPSEGIYPFMLKDSWGLLNKHEQFLLQPRYQEVEFLSSGIWRVQKDGLDGLFDIQKGMIIGPSLEDARLSEDGRWIVIKKNGYRGLVDLEGIQKTSIVYSEIQFLENKHFLVKRDQSWDLLDPNLKVISPFNLSFITSNEKGRYLIQKRADPKYLELRDR